MKGSINSIINSKLGLLLLIPAVPLLPVFFVLFFAVVIVIFGLAFFTLPLVYLYSCTEQGRNWR